MKGKISKAEAARRYNIPATSIRKILDAWYNEGLIHAKPRGGKRKEVTKFEDKHGTYIQELLDEDFTRSLDMIKEELRTKFPELADKAISASGLWRFLTERIGFTLKQTKAVKEIRNSPETIEQRYDYVVKRLPAERGISYKTNYIFVNEAAFNANRIRGQEYSKRGSAYAVVNASKRAVNISILVGISYHGVENVSVKIVKGGTTGSIFKLFVYNIMKKLDKTNAGPHFFVMDNARILTPLR
ncbi:hypothetical protein [Parasitella parasitica]|uniref:Uncharacterized protein n=1 Tax=Parasitella parasitica TaxID=35722 RepID=A0A0B7NLV4_9FUNG|nr:hypothetical protein [Parasitella parasitica]